MHQLKKTYWSGLTFFSQFDLSASSAVIRLSGSNSSILSNKSSAGPGINTKSSRSRRRCCFFGFSVWKNGNLMTVGQTAGVGVPHSRDIISSWAISTLAWNSGFFENSSPRIQPQLHTSIDGPYRSSPNSSSGGRYHSVMTLLV